MTVFEKIEAQQKGIENTAAWMVGEQLKDICAGDPHCAELVLQDLDNKDMSIQAAEKKIKAYAVKAREAAEKETKLAQEKLAEVQKSAKLSSPDVAVFNNIYTEVQMQFNRLVGSLKKIRVADPTTAGKLQNAVVAMLDKLRQDATQ